MQGRRAWVVPASVGVIAFIAGASAATAYLVGPLGFRSPASTAVTAARPSPSAVASPSPAPQTGPSLRTGASMAFDEARNLVALFGGSGFLADTWTWDGKSWTQQHPAVVPPGRVGAGMTYNPDSKLVLMWGGYEANGQGADFWSWDGSNWAQVRSATFPPAEDISGWAVPAPILTFDSKRHLVVLIRNNGSHPAFPKPVDVWTFNGSTWSQAGGADFPPIWGTAAYDPALGAVLFFGVDSKMTPQTWSFNGTQWTRLPSVLAPTVPLDDPPPMVFFKPANSAILVDGAGGLWAWQAGDWTQKSQSSAPTAATGYSVVFDSVRGVLVRFGGSGRSGAETWVSNGQSWTQAA